MSDFIGAFAVSVGFGVNDMCDKFEKELDDYNIIMVKAVADRLAEVSANYWSKCHIGRGKMQGGVEQWEWGNPKATFMDIMNFSDSIFQQIYFPSNDFASEN